jgi:tyrosinase
MGVRKNYRNLTDVERDRFVQALFHVKSTGLVDQFAEIHRRHFLMNIHRSSHFLPWHREMLLRFERELQRFHPDITIPYWDSTVDRSPSDPLWSNNFLGQFNSAWNLRRALGSGPLSTQQEVETNQRRDNYDAFWRELENPIHNRPHVWVGGEMNDFDSPHDPVFYLHHCWIDMLWARWQLAHPGVPFVSSAAGAGLNDPLMEWPDRTPAHVLNHHALGYSYDIEQPTFPDWEVLDNNPASVAIAAASNNLYQRHNNGFIWRYTGPPMTGWQLLDNNPASVAIVAADGNLYQRHNNGFIWRYTGTPMTGWQLLDNNPATRQVVAAGGNLYQLHNNGNIWKYTGPPLTGWRQLDNQTDP